MTHHSITARDLETAIQRGEARAAIEFRAGSVRYRPYDDAIEIITTDRA